METQTVVGLTVNLVIDATSVRDAEKLFDQWMSGSALEDDRLIQYEVDQAYSTVDQRQAAN